jgi:hypothetical protein
MAIGFALDDYDFAASDTSSRSEAFKRSLFEYAVLPMHSEMLTRE